MYRTKKQEAVHVCVPKYAVYVPILTDNVVVHACNLENQLYFKRKTWLVHETYVHIYTCVHGIVDVLYYVFPYEFMHLYVVSVPGLSRVLERMKLKSKGKVGKAWAETSCDIDIGSMSCDISTQAFSAFPFNFSWVSGEGLESRLPKLCTYIIVRI